MQYTQHLVKYSLLHKKVFCENATFLKSKIKKKIYVIFLSPNNKFILNYTLVQVLEKKPVHLVRLRVDCGFGLWNLCLRLYIAKMKNILEIRSYNKLFSGNL